MSPESIDPLTAAEVRILGALAEKEATVADTYPLTLKALISACNQMSAREPVVDYNEREVENTLAALKAKGFVRYVHPSHGARTTRYRHTLDEVFGIAPAELALLQVLMLRGPQTAAELRRGAERAYRFDSVGDAEAVLQRLADRDRPLVAAAPRQPGQKEGRWVHLLAGPPDLDALGRTAAASSRPPPPRPGPGADERMESLEAEVQRLHAAVDHLYALLDADPPPASG